MDGPSCKRRCSISQSMAFSFKSSRILPNASILFSTPSIIRTPIRGSIFRGDSCEILCRCGVGRHCKVARKHAHAGEKVKCFHVRSHCAACYVRHWSSGDAMAQFAIDDK